jgi:hypothetical protein
MYLFSFFFSANNYLFVTVDVRKIQNMPFTRFAPAILLAYWFILASSTLGPKPHLKFHRGLTWESEHVDCHAVLAEYLQILLHYWYSKNMAFQIRLEWYLKTLELLLMYMISTYLRFRQTRWKPSFASFASYLNIYTLISYLRSMSGFAKAMLPSHLLALPHFYHAERQASRPHNLQATCECFLSTLIKRMNKNNHNGF